MNNKKPKSPTPRDMFERKIRHQFGLNGAVLRALGELHYQGKP